MILVDTSVWVAHLRDGDTGLETLLSEEKVACHPFIIGELACGNLKNRHEILTLLGTLPAAVEAEHEEVLQLIEDRSLMGKGLGYIDIHLLASAILGDYRLWTLDKKLNDVSSKLGLSFQLPI